SVPASTSAATFSTSMAGSAGTTSSEPGPPASSPEPRRPNTLNADDADLFSQIRAIHVHPRPASPASFRDRLFPLLFNRVVRRFLRDPDVVRMALSHARARDPAEPRIPLEFLDRPAPAIAQRRSQPAH